MSNRIQSLELALMTWPQIRALQSECSMILLPLGATEQHGPALPISTDTIIAEALCREVSRRTGVPFAPTLSLTSSGAHTTKWPGTFSMAPLTFIQSLVQWARWAEATGWKKILFVNAHAGNHAPLRVAVDQIRLELLGKIQVGLVDTFTLTPEIAARFTSDANDLHANKAESDLILHLAPDCVDTSAFLLADDPDRTEGLVFSYPVSQTSLNGTTGTPSGGRAEDGCQLFEMMCEALTRITCSGLSETPPLPESEWRGTPEHFFSL
jgi:creatinine amidohydrolase